MKKITIAILIILSLILIFKGKKINGIEESENNKPTKNMELTVKVSGIEEGKPIDKKFAYCVGKDGSGENVRPEISWQNAPEGTKSFAVIVLDADVPTDFTDAGKEGKTIPANQKRQNFFHYALVDITADVNNIESGSGRGKEKTQPKFGKSGVNDYAFFMPDADKSDYIGWDGMCPPWNDALIHNYQFMVFALKVETLGLPDNFSAKEAYEAILKNNISFAKVTGTYTRNENLVSKNK